MQDAYPGQSECESGGLAHILSRVSRHLDAMAGQVFSLEEAVGRSLPEASNTENSIIRELQTLDLLRQSLEDLALLAHHLHLHSEHLGGDLLPVSQIGQKLRLDSTRTLLHGQTTFSFEREDETLGDLDLF
ncbi:hypothetical protein AB1M95_08920 [Sulfitobacter sp. LCG007]